ncbi:sarcosine oxidase subunit gamma [Sphingomonas mali]|uniref:sarcosine oxidase subunit gamma n=1 Tax=Sphingomonas mali TaxID=40682 RepID=UPI00082A1912|nr:sarcosine oxidase subunit gamma family protein [Sphingomonas mali]
MVETVTITERTGLGLAIIQARKSVDRAAIGAALGLDLPDGPGCNGDHRLAAIGTGPGSWFLVSEDAGDGWAEALASALDGRAALFDQSSGYAVVRLSGAGARTVLQAGVAIDLHPDRFGAAASVATQIAHIGVLLWQAADGSGFDLAFYRSYRASLEHWLTGAVAAR